MSEIFKEIGGEIGHSKKASTYLAEAEFGYRTIKPYLLNLKPGSNVLEVGVGAGLLMRQCARDFPDLNFTGLEPMGDGFAFFDAFLDQYESAPNAVIHRMGYEQYHSDQRFDLIYLVNVFEHLPNWKGFMGFLRDQLTADGCCLILCPNYTFPYEPHFRLPVIFGKRITRHIFGRRIRAFERENDCEGLWLSLNFVKYASVASYGKSIGLNVHNEPSVVKEMVDRLANDIEFQKRQGVWALPVRALERTGILTFLTKSRFFSSRLPYMKLLINLQG